MHTLLEKLAPAAVGALACGAAAAQTPIYQLTGSFGDGFGRVVEPVGDVNADGYEDLAVGEPFRAGTGSMKVFSGLDGMLIRQTNGFVSGHFGSAFTALGDVNNDGYDDFAVGTYDEFQSGIGRPGAVRIASGFTLTTGSGVLYLQTYFGTANGDRFGESLGSMADLDGDGVRELIVGAPGEDANATSDHGQVYVFSSGSLLPLRTYTGGALPLPTSAFLGSAVAGMGDVNGDAVPDFVAGVSGDATNGPAAGAAFVLSGQDGSFLHAIYGQSPGDQFGTVLDAGADMDGDGIDDVVVGIPLRDEPFQDQGKVRLFRGHDGFPIDSILGEDSFDQFGWAVSIRGDVNGDGQNDLVVTAPTAGPTQFEGAVYVYSGGNRTPMGRIDGAYNDRIGFDVAILESLDDDPTAEIAVGGRGTVDVYAGSYYSTYSYCESLPNSTGLSATIGASGSVRLASADFTLVASDCPPNKTGLFFFGDTQVNTPFGDGRRCAGGEVKRMYSAAMVDSGGTASRSIDLNAFYGASLVPGSSWNFQFWFRDPAGPGGSGFNLTNALNATFQ